MRELLDILRFACLSHLALLIFFLMLRYRDRRAARYGALLATGLAAYFLLQFAAARSAPGLVLFPLACAAAVLAWAYWMLALALFRDGFEPRPWRYGALALKLIVLIVSTHPDRPFLLPTPVAYEMEFLRMAPNVVFSALLVGLGLREALRDYAADLIEERRRIRLSFLLSSGLTLLVAIVGRLGMPGPRLGALHEVLAATATMIIIYGLFLTAFDFRFDFFPETAAPRGPERKAIDAELEGRLMQLFQKDAVFREEGLTIGRLAERLGVPEYRLRRLINGGLGYRNFNDFLNRFRIQAACEILLDPGQKQIPVVRIAMDLGYRSLASFNKAFRDLTGKTPTEYRQGGAD
jgi:AraC-like DNA-binding protein